MVGHGDVVAELARRQPVADIHGRLVAGDVDLLRLAARDFHAVLVELLVQGRVKSVRQRLQPVAEVGLTQAVHHALSVVVRTGRHVLAERQGEQPEVLEHHGEDAHVFVVAVFADVDAVEQDLPFDRVVEPAQQIDERGLAAAVHAHYRKTGADFELQVDVPQRPTRPRARLGSGTRRRGTPRRTGGRRASRWSSYVFLQVGVHSMGTFSAA